MENTQKLLHEWRMNQSISLNGKPVSLSVVLQEKDRIQLPLFNQSPLPVPPSFQPIEVLMEDDHLIIVNKPAGITTHPNSPEDADTLLHMVAGHLCVNGDIGFVRHVHRLDKDTTGAILFAKHPLSYSTLSYLLEKRNQADICGHRSRNSFSNEGDDQQADRKGSPSPNTKKDFPIRPVSDYSL